MTEPIGIPYCTASVSADGNAQAACPACGELFESSVGPKAAQRKCSEHYVAAHTATRTWTATEFGDIKWRKVSDVERRGTVTLAEDDMFKWTIRVVETEATPETTPYPMADPSKPVYVATVHVDSVRNVEMITQRSMVGFGHRWSAARNAYDALMADIHCYSNHDWATLGCPINPTHRTREDQFRATWQDRYPLGDGDFEYESFDYGDDAWVNGFECVDCAAHDGRSEYTVVKSADVRPPVADTGGFDSLTCSMVGPTLTCGEAWFLHDCIEAAGHPGLAAMLISGHAIGDDHDGDCGGVR